MSLFLSLPAISCRIAASASRCDLSASVRNRCGFPVPLYRISFGGYMLTTVSVLLPQPTSIPPFFPGSLYQTDRYLFRFDAIPRLELTIYPPSVTICLDPLPPSLYTSPFSPPPAIIKRSPARIHDHHVVLTCKDLLIISSLKHRL